MTFSTSTVCSSACKLALFLSFFLAINANVFSQLSGTYTIGGAMPDYVTFNDAVAALTVEGLGGPVVFNVRDGYYEEQISLPAIANSSEVNSITFQSENEDATLVEIAFEANNLAFYTIELAGCSYVNFHHLTFSALHYDFAHVISSDAAQYIWIEDCVFNGTETPCNNPEKGVHIYTQFGGGSDNWMLLNNEFNHSCFSLQLYEADNWMIDGNHFNETFEETMFIGAGEGMTIRRNTSSSYSIMLITQQNQLQILNNNWNGRVNFDGPSGTPLDHTLVANNFFYGDLTMALIYSQYIDVIGNSFYSPGNCVLLNGGSELNFVNNILYSTGDKVINAQYDAVLNTCYNNDLYTDSGDLIAWNGTDFADLEAWQNNTTYGASSISIDPEFVSFNDLHVCNPALDGLAIPFPELNWDIDFETRDAVNPDLGADEFDPETCGCTLSATATVTSNYNGQAISCFGQQDGSAFCEVSGATGVVSYDWSSGANIAEAIYLGEGEYTCTVTDDLCSVEATVFLGNPQPVNAIILEVIHPTCPDGNNGQVTSLGNGGTMDFTYSWSPAGGDEATGVGLEGGVEYTVSIMDSNGCLVTETVTLNVPEDPEIYASNDVSICAGMSVTIWASGGEAYEWSNELGSQWEVEVTPDVTTTYVVTGYNFAGCSAQDEVTVTVFEDPLVIINDFDPSDVCIGAVPIAIPSTSPSGGTVSGTGVDGDFFDPALAGVGVHVIYYDYSNEFGCAGSASTEIEVHDIPTVVLDPFEAPSFCIDDDAVPLPSGSPAGGNYNGLGVDVPMFDPALAGLGTHDISYIYTDEYNCYSWDIQQVTVNDIPQVTLGAFSADSICTSDAAIPLPVGTPTGGQYFGEGVVGNGFDPNEAGPGIHVITYMYEDANGCSASAEASIHVFDCTSVSTSLSELPMSVFPNPNSGTFTVQIPESEKGQYVFQVIDALGAIVLEEPMNGPTHLAAGLNLEKGVYLLQIAVQEKMYQARIVIQ